MSNNEYALLLYGQPRHCDNEAVYNSFHYEIFDKYNVDVYAHMWFTSSPNKHKYEASSWAIEKGANVYIPDNAPSIICDQYDPIAFQIDRPTKFSFDYSIENFLNNRYMNNEFYSEVNLSNILSQLWSINQVCKLTAHYKKYILARYDAVLSNLPDLDKLSDNKLYIPNRGGFNDLIWIFDSSKLRAVELMYYHAFDMSVIQDIQLPIPEEFKRCAILSECSNEDIVRTNMYAEVIRK